MPLRAQAAPVEPEAANLRVYRDPEVISHYASLDYLTACERHLFDTYLTPGVAILDTGVRGGRATPCLSRKALRDVGVHCWTPAQVREGLTGLIFGKRHCWEMIIPAAAASLLRTGTTTCS